MVRKAQPDSANARSATIATTPVREAGTEKLHERIERLEQRLEASILGDDGLAELDPGIDKSPSGDALKRVLTRSKIKRGGSRKD